MDCVITISLYLKDYISDEQFKKIFWDYIDDYKATLEEGIYLEILFSNCDNKEERISLKRELYRYVMDNYQFIYKNISDAYVENIIESDQDNILLEMLREKYVKKEKITIDCGSIATQLELITAFKKSLQYPQFCGNNWDALEDLLDDIILPEKLCFSNWEEILSKIPQEANTLIELLTKHNNNRTVIIYE